MGAGASVAGVSRISLPPTASRSGDSTNAGTRQVPHSLQSAGHGAGLRMARLDRVAAAEAVSRKDRHCSRMADRLAQNPENRCASGNPHRSREAERAYAVCLRSGEEGCEKLGIVLPSNHEHAYNADILAKEEAEYNAAFRLLCPSDFVAQTFLDEGFSPEKLARDQYGYDETVYHSGQQVRDDRRGLTMLFVGGCAPRKGLHYALEAWLRSPASRKGKFLIAGAFVPGYAEKLSSMLTHPTVEVLGHRSDVPELMRHSDLRFCPALKRAARWSRQRRGPAAAFWLFPMRLERFAGIWKMPSCIGPAMWTSSPNSLPCWMGIGTCSGSSVKRRSAPRMRSTGRRQAVNYWQRTRKPSRRIVNPRRRHATICPLPSPIHNESSASACLTPLCLSRNDAGSIRVQSERPGSRRSRLHAAPAGRGGPAGHHHSDDGAAAEIYHRSAAALRSWFREVRRCCWPARISTCARL